MTRRLTLCCLIAATLLMAGSGCGSPNGEQSETEVDAIQRVTEKGPVKLTVRITPRKPRLSDLVEMEVHVSALPDVEIHPPAFGAAVGDFLVLDYSEQKSPADEPGTRRFRYQLEPVLTGTHLIRSILVEFTDNRSDSESRGELTFIESEPIEVEVTSELGDQVPDLANLEPMLPPRPLPESTSIGWLLAMIVAIAAILLVFWWRRSRTEQVSNVTLLTPEEIADAALTALLAENLPAQGLVKEFYLRLTGIVRRYIEARTGLRAPEQTTEEFLQAIQSRHLFPLRQSSRLSEFLVAADMVKYAGQQPDADQIELSISRAREFVGMPISASAAEDTAAAGSTAADSTVREV